MLLFFVVNSFYFRFKRKWRLFYLFQIKMKLVCILIAKKTDFIELKTLTLKPET